MACYKLYLACHRQMLLLVYICYNLCLQCKSRSLFLDAVTWNTCIHVNVHNGLAADEPHLCQKSRPATALCQRVVCPWYTCMHIFVSRDGLIDSMRQMYMHGVQAEQHDMSNCTI